MRIVAIETSGRHGSLAVLLGESGSIQMLGEVELATNQRTAQSLAPTLRRLLADVNWLPDSIGLVAVAVGPGSFTGLRIGVTTAKAFAYAVGAEIIGVNTLDVLATQAQTSPSPIWTIMDAQRQELFAAKFDAQDRDEFRMTSGPRIVAQETWINELQPGDRVTGPALKRILPRIPTGVVALPEELWQPTAAAVGRLAWCSYNHGQRDDMWKLVPAYYRPSAAEEKAAPRGLPKEI